MVIPGKENAINEIRKVLVNYPDVKIAARQLPRLYIGQRGLMVVDVVASRQRKYEEYVKPKLLTTYVERAKDLSLASLADKAPTWMKLRVGEALVMKQVAQQIIKYSKNISGTGEDELCKAWAEDKAYSSQVLEIKGIGPALYQYLRMLCGADSLKSDLRVKRGLQKLGLPIHWFSDEGVLELCMVLANEIGCTLVELDQCLYKVLGNENV
jgi:hypothetical protein